MPVIGRALALKRRIERMGDSQLFVALSASQTSAENLPRVISALEMQVDALQRALQSLREALDLWAGLNVFSQARAVTHSFRALIDALR